MLTKRGGSVLVLLLVLFLMSTAVGLDADGFSSKGQEAQSARNKAAQSLQYDSVVTLKLVQVSVVDKKGNPVRDLTIGDFVVYDNGKPVTLTDFEKHTIGPLPAGAEEKPSVATSAAGPAPKAPELNRKFFLFFDFAFNNERGLTKSREAALAFLDKSVSPEDEIAVLTYSMVRGIRIREYLTREHAKVREIIENIGGKDVSGRADEIEERYWAELTKNDDGSRSAMVSPGDKYGWERQEGKSVAQFYSERLSALAEALRAVPGRKYFLFFSTGVPASLIYGMQQGSHFDTGDGVLRGKYESMVREFGASGCTVFSFDSRATAKKVDLFAYDERAMGVKANVVAETSGIYQREGITGRDSLQRMSQVTGGEYFGNIDSHDRSLTRIEKLTASYYVLGFPVREEEDGQYHEVKVEVGRPGCKVVGSSGYFNPKPFREMDREEKMLHLFDLVLNEAASSRLPDNFPARTVPISAGEDTGIILYGMLNAELAAKLSGGPLELVSVVFGPEGNVLDLQVGRTESAASGPYLLTSFVPAGAGTYNCRLVARNMATGKAAVSSVWKTVVGTPAPGEGLKVLQPMLFGTSSCLVFRLSTRPSAKGPSSISGLYPFNDGGLVPIVGTVEAFDEVTAAVPCIVPKGTESELAASAYLIDSGMGARVPAEFVLKDREKKGKNMLLTLGMPSAVLKPGTYVLYVNVRVPGSGEAAGGRTSFTVVDSAP